MEAVKICILKEAQPIMMSSMNCQINSASVDQISVDVTEYQDFVFLLGQFWKVDVDQVKSYWVCNLFAIGLFDNGKKVNKTICLHNLSLFFYFLVYIQMCTVTAWPYKMKY